MSRYLLALIFTCMGLALSGPMLSQPCTRTGWVSSVLPGCGAVIVDQSTGESLRAVKGADLLTGGQYIRFTASPTQLPPTCPPSSLPTVALTCLSDTLPCTAQFDHAPGEDKTLEHYFEAFIVDEQQQTCTWFFGDGSTGTGRSVKHTYAQAGVYEVCLSVSDVWGCQAKSCRKVIVGQGQSLTCGYDLLVTALDKTLLGYLVPKSNPAGELLAVQWRLSKQSEVLAETPSLLYTLPHYGSYIITAEYAVRLPDGSFCTSANSEALIVAPAACEQPLNTDAILFCAPYDAPVCGCDQITYPNECEALTAGASSWWAGTCDQMPGSCQARMEAQVLVGSPLSGFFTQFRNLSSGHYVFAQLDFGDGSTPWLGTQTDSLITHQYLSGGIYRASFTVWSPNGCESSVTQLVVTDALQRTKGKLPPTTDYVYPGDTNGDKKANVYDLLHIGVGHDLDGVPRPNAHTDWMPQFAPNWDGTVGGQINLKHADCDGNGSINDFDADVIQLHYQAIPTKQASPAPQAPRLRVDLQGPDTIRINPALPATLRIKADVHLGSPAEPVLDLYGVAYALQYPEFVSQYPEAVFLASNNVLFGETHHLMQSRDIHPRRQLDMGLVKTNHESVKGYGKIAEITFSLDYIIIIDVIGRTESHIVPFVVPIGGIRGIDSKGNLKEVSVPAVLDTIWIMLDSNASHSVTPNASDQVAIYPNPATGQVLISTADLDIQGIEVQNAVGQVVYRQAILHANRVQRIDVADWIPGCYMVRVLTPQGAVEKRLIVAGSPGG